MHLICLMFLQLQLGQNDYDNNVILKSTNCWDETVNEVISWPISQPASQPNNHYFTLGIDELNLFVLFFRQKIDDIQSFTFLDLVIH